ncbi:MAG: glycine--tRNA ligase [Defluviitaleaceae bacterium]|nr:glycine--tRNA ligase [Defluviitaleaceae bacterium]
MEKIVNVAKTNGFVYQGSEIYGGLANTWDYGPLGSRFKNNVKQAWIHRFITSRYDNVLIDSAILMNPKTWVASGHVGGFSDPLMDCKACKTRHRADKLIEEHGDDLVADGWTNEQMMTYIKENGIICPDCGKQEFTDIRQFELMFKTHMGVVEDASAVVYMRPETAQGIFVNFKNVLRSSRKKIPFGIGQIGKSFRNEITPGNFIFRTREFEQMELEFFCKPGEDGQWYEFWKTYCMQFLTDLGMKSENVRMREHTEAELSHYSNGTSDIEYKFPFGWGELWGIANRTDYDLNAHMTASGVSFEYQDPITNEKYIPFCIEPSVGLDRLMLALFIDAYEEEQLENGETREVLRFHPALAPYQVAVLPLMKKINAGALELFDQLSQTFSVDYDEAGSIGKRYRRQDAIGTPFCVTYDYESMEDHTVTVRHRDTMKQARIAISDLAAYLSEKVRL